MTTDESPTDESSAEPTQANAAAEHQPDGLDLARAAARAEGGAPDRFEGQELILHERVRRAFLDIAEEEPERCIVIDASQPEAMVAEDVWEAVLERLHP